MGVVIRQSFWGTIIAYLGVVIGFVNALYLRPEFLTLDQIGIFTLVTANAMLISPLCSAGMPSTFIKFFPEISSNQSLKYQFFTFQMLVVLGLNVLVITVAYLNKDWLVGLFQYQAEGYTQYLAITAVIIVVNSLFDMLFAYCRSLLQVLVPTFLRDIFLRMGAIFLVGGFALDLWDFPTTVKGLAINYVLGFTFLWIYLMAFRGLKFSFNFRQINPPLRKRLLNFAWYLMLLALSFSAMNNVNYLQVSIILGDRANGIFTTCFFIGLIVEIPRRSILNVLSPLISKAMQEDHMEAVGNIYKKGSITMSIFGTLLFIGILTNLDDLLRFVPQGGAFEEGYWVVIFICSAKLLQMVFSSSQEIIVYSTRYKMTLYLQLLGALMLVSLNMILLPSWGLIGAGFSYFVVVLVHSLLKFFFVYKQFNISPFVKSHLPLLIISLVIFVVFLILPFPFSPVLNILIRSTLTTLVFMIGVFKMEISSETNNLIRITFERMLKIKRQ